MEHSSENTTIKVFGDATLNDFKKHDVIVVFADALAKTPKNAAETALARLPQVFRRALLDSMAKSEWEWKPKQVLRAECDGIRVVLVLANGSSTTFDLLTLTRKVVSQFTDLKPKSIMFDLRASTIPAEQWADTMTAAFVSSRFKPLRYGKKAPEKAKITSTSLHYLTTGAHVSLVKKIAERSLLSSRATNLVRWLGRRAPNDLSPKTYRTWLQGFAKERNLEFQFHDRKDLRKMGAGAFVAVADASSDDTAGIAILKYRPKGKRGAGKSPTPDLALVGKGVTFDTGGINVKSAQYMYGMQLDMTGSAVAVAVLDYLHAEDWPIAVDAYLAIAANDIGPNGYRPNDVITSLKGSTIEIVHTDAEGRMMLADTLTLASRAEPKLIMDFATLTGSCVKAIGTNYSGVFTNREHLHAPLTAAGKSSGERVWPFPLDADFAECLESDIADIKQCRLTGGVDHIEASMFLKTFLDKDVAWVHVDLSSCEHAGGLAHVDTEVTGFGVRFATAFLAQYFSVTP